jgi:hypothetical protein
MSVEFTRITSLLTEMPCSEAAAERLFSVMKWIQTKDRLKMNRPPPYTDADSAEEHLRAPRRVLQGGMKKPARGGG